MEKAIRSDLVNTYTNDEKSRNKGAGQVGQSTGSDILQGTAKTLWGSRSKVGGQSPNAL